MRQTLLFSNQLVYEEILNWLGFAFASDGRVNDTVYDASTGGSRQATKDDMADDAAYGMTEASNLMRRHGTAVNVIQ